MKKIVYPTENNVDPDFDGIEYINERTQEFKTENFKIESTPIKVNTCKDCRRMLKGCSVIATDGERYYCRKIFKYTKENFKACQFFSPKENP